MPHSTTSSVRPEAGTTNDRNRPNVLFVICDQLKADHLGFAGNPVVRTPNIDAIAEGGTVFDRAFVNNPICMPNRSTIMTGRMPSAHGVIFNDRSLDPNANTFVRQLRTAGWRTALIGKSHLQHGMSRETIRQSEKEPGHRSALPDGWDTIEHQERYEAGEAVAVDDFYGFEHIELTIGHGAWSGGHHYQWALDRGATHEQLRCGLDPDAEVPARSLEWWQVHAAPFPDEAYSTTFVTERTIDFIEKASTTPSTAGRQDQSNTVGDQPWMVWCSYPDPHHPVSPPEPWFSRHDPGDIDLPATFHDPGEHWPEHLTRIRSQGPNQTGFTQYVLPFGPTEAQARHAIAGTYGMIEAIDHGIGQIVEALERTGQAENTIIVFTSDHGDMMGDHGLLLKGVFHFDGVLRVPLVINRPGQAGTRTTSLAASIDLPQTLLELCGLSTYQGMQGTSLVPTLDDERATSRDSVLIENDFPSAESLPWLPVKTRTIITDQHRFTRDIDGSEMLFDTEADPDELINLAVVDTDQRLRGSMLTALTDAMLGADDMTRSEPITVDLDPANVPQIPTTRHTT